MVVEDGLEFSGSDASKPLPWVLLSVGVLTGIGALVIFFSSASGRDADVSPTTVPSTGVGASVPAGIAGLVPDFPDTLVAISGTGLSTSGEETGLQHVMLGSDQNAIVSELAVGSSEPVAIDVAGTNLAVTVLDEDRVSQLSIGTPGHMQEVAAAVTSFVWHDSRPGHLAYTTVVSGEWQLHVIEGSAVPRLVMSSQTSYGVVAAWGDWGWAIQSIAGSPTVSFLDESGILISTRPGVAYGSHPSGLVLIVEAGQLSIADPAGGAVGSERSVAVLGPITEATFSPDGRRVAVLGFNLLRVLSTDEGGEVADYKPIVGWPQVVWSSDSRFVLVPGPRGISVIDTQTNTYQEVLPEFGILAMGVIGQAH